MSTGNRSFRGKSHAHIDRRPAELPENIGNRRTFDELKIPRDNVGNEVENDMVSTFVHDGLGNSLEEEPSHLGSGILNYVAGPKTKQWRRVARNQNDRQEFSPISSTALPLPLPAKSPRIEYRRPPISELTKLGAEDYMAHLSNEFSR